MQHIDREQGDRRTQVKQPTSPGIKHLLRLAQVSVKNSDIVLAGQQLIAFRHNPRVYLHTPRDNQALDPAPPHARCPR